MKPFNCAIVFVLSVAVLLPSAVDAAPKRLKNPLTDCSSAVSMVITPDGVCYNLNYLTILGAARSRLSTAKNLQDRAIRLNTISNKATTYTNYDFDGSAAVSSTYSSNVSEEEKQARRKTLDNAIQNLGVQSEYAESVESSAFVIHTYMLGRIKQSFSNPK